MLRLSDTMNFVRLHLLERQALWESGSTAYNSMKDDYKGIIEYAMAAITPLATDKVTELYSYLFENEVGLHENKLDLAIGYL